MEHPSPNEGVPRRIIGCLSVALSFVVGIQFTSRVEVESPTSNIAGSDRNTENTIRLRGKGENREQTEERVQYFYFTVHIHKKIVRNYKNEQSIIFDQI